MKNSNKAIARRIDKELVIRDWSQTDLLKKIIKYKKPDISNVNLNAEAKNKKGNFSTTLKGNDERSFTKEDLYIISKVFQVPFEYIWLGEEKKNSFIPSGARYVAYQDNENEYRAYIASLEKEKHGIQYTDEYGFNLFDYFGQFDSINGYRFFVENYCLHFDYIQFDQLVYVDSDGYSQPLSLREKEYLVADNLIRVLANHNDVKTFRKVFFGNYSLGRFDTEHNYHRNGILFSDNFLDTLLRNDQFLELTLKTQEIELNTFNKRYDKRETRLLVEPMLYEAIEYALTHENDYKEQLSKMLHFALEYSKSQYDFIKNYLNTHEDEHRDVRIDEYNPRALRSSNYIPMGNVFVLNENAADGEIVNLLKEIGLYAFKMTHIINKQEKNNEEIKIATPDNPLFVELNKNALEQNANYIPRLVRSDNEYTYFRFYESTPIKYESIENLKFIIECLDKAQELVASKPNKVLVHGNLSGATLMKDNGNIVGLSGWQKCHYGTKYEDRAELLSNIDAYWFYGEQLEKYKELFDVVSQGFNQEDQVKLIDKTTRLLADKRKAILKDGNADYVKAYRLKESSSKLEYLKEVYLDK